MSDGYWDNPRACTQAGGGGAAVNTDKNGHQCEGTFDDSVFNASIRAKDIARVRNEGHEAEPKKQGMPRIRCE